MTKVLITGGFGFLGSSIRRELGDSCQVFSFHRKEFDLLSMEDCEAVVRGMDIVIHAAAKVGGIGAHRGRPGEFFYENALMGLQVIEACRKERVRKVVIVGTTCSYPASASLPFQEHDIWDGFPEKITAPYGMAKRMLLMQAQAYREQYGMDIIYVMPTNLYGPGDNFDPESSYVIPALVVKFCDAVKNGKDTVVLGGSGRATRDFLYIEDAARGIVEAMAGYYGEEPVNLGSGKEISIAALAEKIAEITGFTGRLVWDPGFPDGQVRRVLDISRAEKGFGFHPSWNLDKGLRETVRWYQNEYQ